MAVPKAKPVVPSSITRTRTQKPMMGDEEMFFVLHDLLHDENGDQSHDVGAGIYYDADTFYALLDQDADDETKAKWSHLGTNFRNKTGLTTSKRGDHRGWVIRDADWVEEQWDRLSDIYEMTDDRDVVRQDD